jgi:hypothetical protein
MRFSALLPIAACFTAPIAMSSARAVPLSAAGIAAAPSPDIQADIQEVAGPRCGKRAHYVRGHRARNGQWIKGRCIRNARHR